jgi:hypothetical protein
MLRSRRRREARRAPWTRSARKWRRADRAWRRKSRSARWCVGRRGAVLTGARTTWKRRRWRLCAWIGTWRHGRRSAPCRRTWRRTRRWPVRWLLTGRWAIAGWRARRRSGRSAPTWRPGRCARTRWRTPPGRRAGRWAAGKLTRKWTTGNWTTWERTTWLRPGGSCTGLRSSQRRAAGQAELARGLIGNAASGAMDHSRTSGKARLPAQLEQEVAGSLARKFSAEKASCAFSESFVRTPPPGNPQASFSSLTRAALPASSRK